MNELKSALLTEEFFPSGYYQRVFDVDHLSRFNSASHWAFSKKFTPQASEGVATSHNCLNGGNYAIPDSYMGDFYWHLARDHDRRMAGNSGIGLGLEVKEPALNYCCEVINVKVMRYFVDFDCKFRKARLKAIDSWMKHICRVMQEAVAKFFPSLALPLLAAYARPHDDLDDGFIKVGLHAVFPEILVSLKQVAQIHEGVKAHMEEFSKMVVMEEGETRPCDALDSKPYRFKGSLRQPTCLKMQDCKSCQNKKNRKATCAECCGQGKQKNFKVYSALFIIGRDSQIDGDATAEFKSNTLLSLYLGNIRVPDGMEFHATDGFKVPEDAPRPISRANDEEEEERDSKRRKIDDSSSYTNVATNKKKKKSKYMTNLEATYADYPDVLEKIKESMGIEGQQFSVPLESLAVAVVEKIIRAISPEYALVHVRDVLIDSKRSMARIYIGGPGQHHCPNKGSRHFRSRVWFSIAASNGFGVTRLVQRCFSDKKEPRSSGWRCCDWSAKVADVNGIIARALFYKDKSSRKRIDNGTFIKVTDDMIENEAYTQDLLFSKGTDMGAESTNVSRQLASLESRVFKRPNAGGGSLGSRAESIYTSLVRK